MLNSSRLQFVCFALALIIIDWSLNPAKYWHLDWVWLFAVASRKRIRYQLTDWTAGRLISATKAARGGPAYMAYTASIGSALIDGTAKFKNTAAVKSSRKGLVRRDAMWADVTESDRDAKRSNGADTSAPSKSWHWQSSRSGLDG